MPRGCLQLRPRPLPRSGCLADPLPIAAARFDSRTYRYHRPPDLPTPEPRFPLSLPVSPLHPLVPFSTSVISSSLAGVYPMSSADCPRESQRPYPKAAGDKARGPRQAPSASALSAEISTQAAGRVPASPSPASRRPAPRWSAACSRWRRRSRGRSASLSPDP